MYSCEYFQVYTGFSSSPPYRQSHPSLTAPFSSILAAKSSSVPNAAVMLKRFGGGASSPTHASTGDCPAASVTKESPSSPALSAAGPDEALPSSPACGDSS